MMTEEEYFQFLEEFMSLFSGVPEEREKIIMDPDQVKL